MNETCQNAEEVSCRARHRSRLRSEGFGRRIRRRLRYRPSRRGHALCTRGKRRDARFVRDFAVSDLRARTRAASTGLLSTPKAFGRPERKSFKRWPVLPATRFERTGVPFTFGVLNSTERRVIHTALQAEDDLMTESDRRRPRTKASGPPQIKDFLNRMIRMLRIEAIFHPAGSVHPVNSLWRIR